MTQTPNISALLVFDSPYGVTDEVWDIQLTGDFIFRIMQQAFASQRSESMIVIIWHKPQDTKIVQDALTKAKFQEFTELYWYKTDHQVQREVSNFTRAVEMCTIGFFPCKLNCPIHLSTNPRDRHNLVEIQAVRNLLRAADGTIINTCQKPRALMSWLCERLAPIGSTILVIGFGSGGEVLGAADCGRNVVGVEQDVRQFQAIQTTLHKIHQDEMAEVKPYYTTPPPESADEQPSAQPSDTLETVDDGNVTEMSEEKCVSCGQLLPIGYDPTITCKHCPFPGPMHPACAFDHADGDPCCSLHRDCVPDSQISQTFQ